MSMFERTIKVIWTILLIVVLAVVLRACIQFINARNIPLYPNVALRYQSSAFDSFSTKDSTNTIEEFYKREMVNRGWMYSDKPFLGSDLWFTQNNDPDACASVSIQDNNSERWVIVRRNGCMVRVSNDYNLR